MTATTSGDDRLRDAFRSLAETAAPSSDCPDPMRFWAAQQGELTTHDARQLMAHAAGCPSCVEVWRLACELSPEVTAADETGRHGFGGVMSAPALRLAAAIVLIVGASAVYLALRPDSGSDEATRAIGDRGIVELLEPLGPQAAAPSRFRWRPMAGATEYHVTLWTNDGGEVWTSTGTATEAAFPAALTLAPGVYQWQVIARSNGEEVGLSRLTEIVIRP